MTASPSTVRPNSFTIENWARALAAAEIVKPDIETGIVEAADVSGDPAAPANGFSCKAGLCLARHKSGAVVAHAADSKAALPACGVANVIVIDDATTGNVCAGKSAVITKRNTARRGSAEVRFRRTVAGTRAEIIYAITEPYRPWHSHRAFSREARGMPPYKRQERKPAAEAALDAAGTLPDGAAHAAAVARPSQ